MEDKEAVLDILCEVDGRALEKFHSTFHLCEDEERSYMLTDILELHFIECPKFRRLPFDIRDPLHRWLRFLDQQATPEQLEALMKVDERFKEATRTQGGVMPCGKRRCMIGPAY